MLKLLPPNSENYHNFKCGEIYCLTAFTYKVNCCMCGNQFEFDSFPHHFKNDHLSKTDVIDQFENDQLSKLNEQDIIKEDLLEHQEIQFEHEAQEEIDVDELELQQENPINIDVSEYASVVNKSNIDDENLKTGECKTDDEDSDADKSEKESNSAERPFPCSKCERAYKSKRGLWNHLRINHNPNHPKKVPKKLHQCEQCGESFRTERHLRGHMWKHTGISCDICGKTFTQTGNLMRHKIRHTGVKAYRCQECDFSFYTEKELRSHMIKHTQKFPIICEICGRRCRDHGVLTAHMRRHTNTRPAKCQQCGKSFFSFHDLNVHAVSHTTARPFSCEVCGSTFQRKKALRVHKKLHSTDRKHVCKICGKAFTQSSGLNTHMRRHESCSKTSGNADNTTQQEEPTPPLESDVLILNENPSSGATNWST